MAKAAKAGENFSPEFSKKVTDETVKLIEQQWEKIDSSFATYRSFKKGRMDKVSEIRKKAKDDGADLDAVNELLKRRKAARAQKNRIKKLTKDTLEHVNKSAVRPTPAQLDMFKDPNPEGEPSAAENHSPADQDNVTKLRH